MLRRMFKNHVEQKCHHALIAAGRGDLWDILANLSLRLRAIHLGLFLPNSSSNMKLRKLGCGAAFVFSISLRSLDPAIWIQIRVVFRLRVL